MRLFNWDLIKNNTPLQGVSVIRAQGSRGESMVHTINKSVWLGDNIAYKKIKIIIICICRGIPSKKGFFPSGVGGNSMPFQIPDFFFD